MNGRSVIAVVAGALACLTLGAARPEETPLSKIQPLVLRLTEGGHRAEFFVVLRDQADLSYAQELATKEAKGVYVYSVLSDKAERSQAPIRTLLEARGIEYQPFFIVNAILVKMGDRALAMELAGRDDVDRIEGNPVIQNDLPKPEAVEDAAPDGFAACATETAGPNAPQAVEWNVTKVNAPGVWALGYRGQGIVVGAQDTGYRWTHTFIKNQYRGWNGVTADHNYNWHDSVHSGGVGGTCTGPDMLTPCDDDGHGTHTISTVLGDDGGTNQTGVAPQAKWIGCRNMNLGAGTPATYLECFQFFLAPTMLNGTNPDPAKAPHVTTNSWGCPTSEGCSWNTLQTAVDNQKAAGIMTVVAAGNSGSGCNTVTDAPAMYLSAYTVGSTTSSDTMSSFSSRGVGTGNNAMKPDIVAPGSNVRGATNTSDTATMTISGTSMATPHVAGVVALLWSARSCLTRQQDATAAQINSSATKLTSIVEACGGNYVTGPNNTWGNGLVNALAAVNGYSCCTTPGVPAIGTATVPGNNQIAVSWTAGAPAGSTYNIYRSAGACPGGTFVLVRSGQSTSPWTDTAVSGGLTYAYKVSAVDTTGGCESAQSGCVSATATGPCTSAPTFAGLAGVANPGNATCTLSLSWAAATPLCGGPVTYSVYRSTTAPFTPSGANRIAAGVSGTSYSDSASLTNGATYSYIVRAVDASNSAEDANLVTASGVPTGPFTAGTWSDDAGDTGTAKMIADPTWAAAATGGHTGAKVYATGTYAASACISLTTPALNIAAGSTLTFWSHYDLETNWDKGQVESSTDGGSTWARLAITTYPATATQAADSCGFPAGTTYFTGTNAAWASYTGTPPAGANVKLRWRLGSDSSFQSTGWWIDDVTITNVQVPGTCTTGAGTPPPEIAPGGSVGTSQSWPDKTTHAWPADGLATGYKVYRGVQADLPNLLGGGVDSCTKYTGSATSTATVTEDPAAVAGRFYWYLVTGTNLNGEGVAGNATAGPRVVNSSGLCP